VWRLLEPRVRRAAFLDEVVRELDLDCEVVRMTATDAARDPVFSRAHDLATARALAPAPAAFALLLPLVAAGGLAAVFHGPASELPEQAERWAPGVATMTAPATSLRKELED
ncbi:MAG TPA: RsmG family class I SAM-dependent methyltransferase, partial [Actinomycetota bacterium]|nr:RsmG family class I SAM-dependent methyltransferase [Actinomycetota bacterium]